MKEVSRVEFEEAKVQASQEQVLKEKYYLIDGKHPIYVTEYIFGSTVVAKLENQSIQGAKYFII